MANITDLTQNSISETDNTSVQIGSDSNVNVFEFGNLILADILPTLLFLTNYEDDDFGISLSVEELDGSSESIADKEDTETLLYNDSLTTYNSSSLSYSGYVIPSGLIDRSGS